MGKYGILVGGIPTPLKNDGVKVSWDDDIPNIWKVIKKCSKPPTSTIVNGFRITYNLVNGNGFFSYGIMGCKNGITMVRTSISEAITSTTMVAWLHNPLMEKAQNDC